MKQKFTAVVGIIDVNPYVAIPEKVLRELQKAANKEIGPLPVKGTLQGKPYLQTVVKFRGMWRLCLNTQMRQDSKTQVGDKVTVEIECVPQPCVFPTPKPLAVALSRNNQAKRVYDALPPSRQKEINRYLASLKTEESMKRNVKKIIRFLTGKKTEGVLFR